MSKASKKEEPKAAPSGADDGTAKPAPEPAKKYGGTLKRYEIIGDVTVTLAGAKNADGRELTGIQVKGGEMYMDPKTEFTKRFIAIGVIK